VYFAELYYSVTLSVVVLVNSALSLEKRFVTFSSQYISEAQDISHSCTNKVNGLPINVIKYYFVPYLRGSI
jgi:hypothetical protein